MSTGLQTYLMQPASQNRIAIALGYNDATEDNAGVREAKKYVSSVLTVIQNADPKTKLQSCTKESIMDCCIDAATMKVAIDGRKHAALIAYSGKATLQITSAGYEAKLYEHLDRCSVLTGKVFEGDTFERWTENDYDHFKHIVLDPFQEDKNKIKGIFVAISWYEGNIKYQKVEILTKAELNKIMGCAKQTYVWDKWFLERATTAAIKRAAKRFFHKTQGLQELVTYDNERNYSVDTEMRSSNNLVQNLNKQIKGEPEQPDIDGEAVEVPEEDIEAVPVNEAPEEVPEAQEDIIENGQDQVMDEPIEMENISEAAQDVVEEEEDVTGGGLFP